METFNYMKEDPSLITHDCPIKRVKFRRLARLYFASRQVGQKRGDTRDRAQVSTCNATVLRDKMMQNVARITGP